MDSQKCDSLTDLSNMGLAKKCLAKIADIAGRGACSDNPDHVGYALQELSQVMFERTESEDIRFVPTSPDEIHDLRSLHEELDFVDCGAHDIAVSARS